MADAPLPFCFITNEHGDRYLYEVNHNSLNKEGARRIHEQRFGKLIERENVLLVICGTDSGTLLPYLNTASIASGTKVVLVELPEILSRIEEEFDLSTLKSTVRCVEMDSFQAMLEQFGLKNYLYMGSVELHQSRAAEHAFLPEYQGLLWNLQTSIQQLAWNIQGSLGFEPFLLNQLENLGDNVVSARHLKNCFNGRTGVLLAGGPSLDDILPWVKENRENLVVLAVSRISRRLREINLTPDMIFSIDPHQMSFDISREMLLFDSSCLFVHVYHVFSKLLGQWRGRSVYLGDRVPWPSDLNVESLPHPGPTVSNVALSTAMEMGFERVILAGVDLCHSKDGYSHAIGSNERFAGPHLGKVCIRVDTYGGWTAETTSDFAPAIAILDVQAKTCLERGVRLINPAPGAARIEHIEHIPLEEIILEPGMRSAAEIFREVLPEITTQYRLNYYKKAIKEISRVLGQLIQIHKLSVEAIRCNDGLFGRRGMKRDFKHKKRMDKIEKTLNSKHDKFSRLVKTFGIRNFLKLTRIDRDKEWDDAEIEKTGRAYYQAYRDSASSLIDMVRQSRDRLEMRVEEEKESPRMELLFKQWSKDEQPGRILVWLARRGLKIEDLDPEQRSSAEKLLADFTQMNSQTDTEHMRRSRSFADLGGVRAKTLAFFRQNNFSGLRDLKEALAAHPDPKAEKFVHLCEGYLAEMAGNNDKALEHYQLLFDEQDESLLEDILRRITSITLTRNDVDNSTLALESLCHISPTYLPQYGDFLRLIGSHQEAIGAYLFYLEQIPFDTAMMLKVGAYYRELNMEEGARAMFEHILQREPDNNRARRLLAGE